jgi:hypothetical protein
MRVDFAVAIRNGLDRSAREAATPPAKPPSSVLGRWRAALAMTNERLRR